MTQGISEKRRLALEIASKRSENRASISQRAYKQQQQEEMARLENTPEHEKQYAIEEINQRFIELKEKLAEYLTEHHSYELKGSMFDLKTRKKLYPIILSYIQKQKAVISGYDDTSLTEAMVNEIAGLGPIDEIMQREGFLNEIWVNGENPITGEVDIYYEKGGVKYKETLAKFRDKAHVSEIAKKIARNGQQLFGTEMPLANVRYPNGRVNLVQEPVATGGGGPFISFRLFPKDTFKPQDFVKSGSMSQEMYEFTKLVWKYGLNGIMCGATGSGKTTLLTACVDFIDNGKRILLMEDTEEMRIRHKYPDKHIITEECKFNSTDKTRNFDLSALTKNALRQKPDYMIYGEVRDSAAYDMLNGAVTGHRVWSSLHSRSAVKAVQRIITMVQEHGSKMSTDAIGKWITQAIDVIYFQKLYSDNVRRVREIIQLVGFEDGVPQFRVLFKFIVTGKDDEGNIIGRHYRIGQITKDLAEYLVDEGADIESVKKFLKKPDMIPPQDLFSDLDDDEFDDD